MRVVIMWCKDAKVEIPSHSYRAFIKDGLLIIVGFCKGDIPATVEKFINKLGKLRLIILNQQRYKLKEYPHTPILLIPNFTLCASYKKNISFHTALETPKAQKLYEYLLTKLKQAYPNTQGGIFKTTMHLHIYNIGPYTYLLDI